MVDAALAVICKELESLSGCKSIRTGDVDKLAPGDSLYHRGRNFIGIPTCEPLRARFGTTTCDLDETSQNGWSVLQTLLPFDGEAVRDAIAVLKAGVDTWGVSRQPHITSVSSRAINLMTMIWFPRGRDGIARMRGLRDELHAKLIASGCYPSREGIDTLQSSMAEIPRDETWAKLKVTFDPNGVIAPGRYISAEQPSAG